MTKRLLRRALRGLLLRAAVVVAMLAAIVPMLPAQDSTSAVSATRDVVAHGTARVSRSIATRALRTGDTLRAADLARRDTVIVWRWSHLTPDTTLALPGWIARRPIAVGEVLRAPAVMAPPLITTGATVRAIWQDGTVQVVMTGIATNTAALGAPVGVRVGQTRRLDGIAVAPNTVRLR